MWPLKKILLWIAVAFVALGVIQPNVGSGVAGWKFGDIVRVPKNDEDGQKCPGQWPDCPELHQAYCTYFTALGLNNYFRWGLVERYPALSKSRWAPEGTRLIRHGVSELVYREVISNGIYAGWSTWPRKQEALDDIGESCPLTYWQYRRKYNFELEFPAGHRFVSPSYRRSQKRN